jgi:hypothetical protein
MKWWNSQGNRVIIGLTGFLVPSCIGRRSENIFSSTAGVQKKKGKTGWNSVCHQNWWKKLVWVPIIVFCKIFIPSYTFDALLCWNWSFLPPNQVTLQITLTRDVFSFKFEPVLFGFSFLREPLVLFWHFKIYVTIPLVHVSARFFQNLNLSIPILAHFFKFKNLWTHFLNWVWFHVHITHSPMLKIMWVQNLTIN